MQRLAGPQLRMQGLQQPLMASSSFTRRAYVGQSTPLANEYYSQDYKWSEYAQETAALVEAQWAAAPEAVRQKAQLASSGVPLSAVAQLLQHIQLQQSGTAGCHHSAGSSQRVTSSTEAAAHCEARTGRAICCRRLRVMCEEPAVRADAAQQPSQAALHSYTPTAAIEQLAPARENEWETFYKAHPTAKFFKERRYLLLEFPCLAPPSQLQHVVEIGAGCGSSLLPVLRAQPEAKATACDVSSTCLDQLNNAVKLLGLHPERCSTVVADGTSPALGTMLSGCCADVALIMFTLSAVQPEGMLVMMQNAATALKQGGLLCIRDHALYDMVQLRIPSQQCVGRHLYKRGDGTLAYFFTVDDLSGLGAAAGLEIVECNYVCVINKNRKTGQQLRRAFVHGLFRRPEQH